MSVPIPPGPPAPRASIGSSTNKAITGPSLMANGRKSYIVNGVTFEAPSYFDITKTVGFGAYGMVCAGIDLRTSRKIAIKKNKHVFRDAGDSKRILREVKFLRMFKHENVLSLKTFYLGSGRFDDVYLVTDLLDTDLATVIRSKQRVSDDHAKYFIYQVLRGLKYVHSADVVHRDLKPQNILVNLNCDLRLCDFGLARGLSRLDQIEMTDYVVTRWYRPPELIMLNRHYTTSVDIWSTGCIFAEIINRKPLFPGSDYLTQLKYITEAVGFPDAQTMAGGFENKEAVEFLQHMYAGRTVQGLPASEILKGSTDPLAHDFLSQMLQFDPRKRSSAAELMAHPFLRLLHDPNDEPDAEARFEWEYEAVDPIDREELRKLFLAEAQAFPELVEHE